MFGFPRPLQAARLRARSQIGKFHLKIHSELVTVSDSMQTLNSTAEPEPELATAMTVIIAIAELSISTAQQEHTAIDTITTFLVGLVCFLV